MNDRALVEVRDLHKSYRGRPVLRGISFDVHEGEIVGLVGPNGAGKTTTVEIMQGLRRPSSGQVRVAGFDPLHDGAQVRGLVGSQLQSSALPGRLTVSEAVHLFTRLAGDVVEPGDLTRHWGLGHLLDLRFDELSGGERQRLFLALAMVNRPRVVFLDELTQGLDAVARNTTWSLVRRVRDEGAAVVLVSHDMAEIEALCDRVLVLIEGHIVEQGSPRELSARLGGPVTLRFSIGTDQPQLSHIVGVHEVVVDPPNVAVVVDSGSVVEVVAELARQGLHPLDLQLDRAGFEEAFLQIAARTSACPVPDVASIDQEVLP